MYYENIFINIEESSDIQRKFTENCNDIYYKVYKIIHTNFYMAFRNSDKISLLFKADVLKCFTWRHHLK